MPQRVFTIPPSAPFLPTLITALRDGRLGFKLADDPLALGAVTLYLPTQRACRLARDAFLTIAGGDAAILPRIVALGDIDEDEIAFADAAGALAEHALELPEALGGLERRLLLTELVTKWATSGALHAAGGVPLVAQTPAAACALADDLARLIDDMTTRAVPWQKLDELVPEQFDKYWQLTLEFLKIARAAWPALRQERGFAEPAARRDALIKAEAERLARHKDGPVIAAGSTGSIPATAALIATIATLPHGAVVLPGLDTDLDEASWRLIAGDTDEDIAAAPGHPQFAMQALLARIGISRDAVMALAPASGRERLLSEALRPAVSTDRWRQTSAEPAFAVAAQSALDSMTVIEAATAEEEALAVALALREAVHDGKTASLVTPDRALGRRVVAALKRWNIVAEDSDGDELIDTNAGVFARLAAEAAIEGVPPVTLLALLKHPLARLGRGDIAAAVAVIERAVLRGPRPRAGSAGLAHALATLRETLAKARRGEATDLHRSDPRLGLSDEELAAAADLLEWLAAGLAPLEDAGRAAMTFADLAARHRDVLAALSGDSVFSGADGVRLADALDDIVASEAAAGLLVEPDDYVELFAAALSGRVVRRPAAPQTNVRILGLLEARLTDSDRVVLGGLVEGVWPPESRNDAWLSRPMRLELGLDLPERRIGLTAHDFAQMLGATDVILTTAAKIAGTPTVASRFIQRLAALAGPNWQQVRQRGDKYLAWARELDRPETIRPEPRPEPRPPRAARPRRLSVTEIEHWLRDPYTIYARHVLKLAPLDPVDAAPGAAERGTMIHDAIGDFAKRFAGALPDDPAAELLKLGRAHFAPLADYPEARAFWWPRFERIARWFAGWEVERRQAIDAIKAEIRGETIIALDDGEFKLTGIADRIERGGDGRYTILDFKTGAARSERQVRTGLAPQLSLEAAILRRGGFPGIASGASVAALGYVLLKGGEPAGEDRPINFKDGAPDDHADRAFEKLAALVRRFDDDGVPYLSLVHPMWSTHYGDYDHLARVKEWSSAGGAEEWGR